MITARNQREWLLLAPCLFAAWLVASPAQAQILPFTTFSSNSNQTSIDGMNLLLSTTTSRNVDQLAYPPTLDVNAGTNYTSPLTVGTHGGGSPATISSSSPFTAFTSGQGAFGTDSIFGPNGQILVNAPTPPNSTAVVFDFGGLGVMAAGVRFAGDNVGTFNVDMNFTDLNGNVYPTQTFSVNVPPPGGITDNAPFIGVSFPTRSLRTLSINFQPGQGVDQIGFAELQFVIPEPSSFALFGLGLSGLAVYGWRKRKPLAK